MIISVNELKEHITTDKTDLELEAKLQALELKIRNYTNNRFHQVPLVRIEADVVGGVFMSESLIPFNVGDTVQVTYGSKATDCGIYTVKEVNDLAFTVNEDVPDMANIKVTKVLYKADVKMGVVEMVKWDLEKRDKVGIKSETISRHSVTYADTTEFNEKLDYPKVLCGFLKGYMKPRF